MKKLLFIFLLLFPCVALADNVNVTQTSVNVTTATTSVSVRTERRLLILENISDTPVSCKFGAAAVLNQGFVLNPATTSGEAGGTIFFDVSAPTGVLNCIHGSSGNKAVLLVEG